MYMPNITGGNLVKTIEFDRHTGELWNNLTWQGDVEYLYVLSVAPKGSATAVLYVSAETSKSAKEMAAAFGIASGYMLCAFVGGGHQNHGSPPGLNDIGVFEEKAVEIVSQALGETRKQ